MVEGIEVTLTWDSRWASIEYTYVSFHYYMFYFCIQNKKQTSERQYISCKCPFSWYHLYIMRSLIVSRWQHIYTCCRGCVQSLRYTNSQWQPENDGGCVAPKKSFGWPSFYKWWCRNARGYSLAEAATKRLLFCRRSRTCKAMRYCLNIQATM